MDPQLNFNKRYLVETKNKNHYIGTYKEFIRDSHGYIMYFVLDNVTSYYTNYYEDSSRKHPEKLKNDAFFSPYDMFYDLDEIKEKGQKATQSMEQRALNKILKRIVNENFEW